MMNNYTFSKMMVFRVLLITIIFLGGSLIGTNLQAQCTADAGTLTPLVDPVQLAGSDVDISATVGTSPTVPPGYNVLYVLTSGTNLLVEDIDTTPNFNVDTPALYTIHTLVAVLFNPADPNYLPFFANIFPGVSTGADILDLIANEGVCADLLVDGAEINVEACSADAGTLTANAIPVQLAGGSVTISATEGTAPTVPTNYEVAYVLTSGASLVIEATGTTPDFEVTSAGLYTIHTLVAELNDPNDPNFLDTNVIVPGTTTGGDVLALVASNGLCASLDVTGAPVTVEDCSAAAGTLSADATPVALAGGSVTISATQVDPPVVPSNYDQLYVLTSGAGLIIEATGSTPSFDVSAAGLYTIHTLVAELDDPNDPNFLDTTGIVLGTTPASDVLDIVTTNGLCAALDVTGAPVTVEDCTANAGTLTANANPVQLAGGDVDISASVGTAPTVPADYEVVYVLTSGASLVIEQTSLTAPSFTVDAAGDYTIHTLVAEVTDPSDPNFLDVSVIVPGTTTGVDVLNIITTNGLCADLDVAGAPVTVEACSADAGTLTANANPVQLAGGSVTISATEGTAPTVPTNYEVAYVLTSGAGLVIEATGATPDFEVTSAGLYTIHTLVAELNDANDPNFLDVSVIVPGTTTGGEVLALIGANGLCASLDVAGAPVTVEDCTADAGTLTADATPVELESGSATISATEDTAPTVPANYEVAYVLTSGTELVIEQTAATPSFTVTAAGDYTIHTLVAELDDPNDPNFLDVSVIVPGTTTGGDVLGIITSNGLCADLDVAGAPIEVTDGNLSIDDNPLAGSIKLRNNPVENDLVVLNSKNTFINSMMIYDFTGRMVKQIGVESAQAEISADVSSLANGTYFLIMNSTEGQLTIRWIKN